MVLPGAAVFLTVELTFFAANLGKLFSGGWLPLAVGAVFFVILTTWRRGRAILHRQVREGHMPLRRFINRLIDEPPLRVPGTAVFLSSAPGHGAGRASQQPRAQPRGARAGDPADGGDQGRAARRGGRAAGDHAAAAGLREHHRQLRVPGRAGRARRDAPGAARGARDRPRPDVVLRQPRLAGAGRRRADVGLAHRLFMLLHRNSTPAARYFHIPPDRVVEMGVYVAV